ncbi:hypothetical protein C2S52_012498 [Perilla frutescens var. hirtella]|nr:hypothetical protein C2S52_012498 [Perilla frutescens var. hirtella]
MGLFTYTVAGAALILIGALESLSSATEMSIEPFVTLLHLDVPQALEDAYGGFLSSQIVADFHDFANLVFEQFGDRVKSWVTKGAVDFQRVWLRRHFRTGPVLGVAGSRLHGRRLCHRAVHCGTQPSSRSLRCAHLYQNKYQVLQRGKIGIVFAAYWFESFNEMNENENENARDRAMDFMLGWYMELLTRGRYRESMRVRVWARLPKFNENEYSMAERSFDFIGFNYYGSMYAVGKLNLTSYSYATDSKMEITSN